MLVFLGTIQIFFLRQPYLVSTALTVFIFITHGIKYRNSKNKLSPPLVPYMLPWIGSALDIGKDPDAFFERARSKFGPIFRVRVLGQEMTYVTSPDAISTVFRDTKAFEDTSFKLEITHKIFGLSHSATYSPFLRDNVGPMQHRGLLPKNVVCLLERYTAYSLEDIQQAIGRSDNKKTSLASFLIPPAYTSAAHTFFGHTFDAKQSYDYFCGFDKYFHLLAMGVPRFILPGPYRAWDEMELMLQRYLQHPHEDCCELFVSMESAARDAGWPDHDIARMLATDLWALEANAIWAGYWVIAHALQKSQGLTHLVAEIDLSREEWKESHPGQSLDANLYGWLSSARFPLLTSMIQESLRLSTSSFSIRHVTEPVVLGGYQLETNQRVVCATRAVHLDESIHPNARQFVSDRYLGDQKKFMKNGLVVPNHTIPFGGGTSMCEGRHFALGELKTLIALVLSYATIKLDAESVEKPTYYKERIGVGVMPPVGDLTVHIRKRIVA